MDTLRDKEILEKVLNKKNTLVKKNKILIPSGTGFLGFHICNFFKKKGWIVHSVSKSKPKKIEKL